MPAVDELHERVAAAGDGGSVRLPGLIDAHVRPAGSGLSARETVPENPLTPVTVTVAAADKPTFTPAELGVMASAISSQYQVALSPNVTGKLATGELTNPYSVFEGAPMNPGAGVSTP